MKISSSLMVRSAIHLYTGHVKDRVVLKLVKIVLNSFYTTIS